MMQTEKIASLAKAIEIVTEVHTRDHRSGFAVEHRASVCDRPDVNSAKYVQAWALLRRAVGKQVSE
jgi:hypothetical protein